jgi:peptidoglycan hydrolase-like protein with peptidoglycan-binding domain
VLGAATGAPYASASPLSGSASPPNNGLWAAAAHGEMLGTNYINTGDVVAFWQGFLASYGLVSCATGIDGRFSPATAAATRSIQSFFGLSKDGIVGPNTWSAAGAWLVWSPGGSSLGSTYDSWQPANSTKPAIVYGHSLPSGAWKWQSPATTDYPNWHGSDNPGISFTPSGSC